MLQTRGGVVDRVEPFPSQRWFIVSILVALCQTVLSIHRGSKLAHAVTSSRRGGMLKIHPICPHPIDLENFIEIRLTVFELFC